MLKTLVLAGRARKHGAKHAFQIIHQARKAGIKPADGLALVEIESEFQNIFGHDWGSNPNSVPFPGAKVTKARAQALYDSVVLGGGQSNGVGLTQLTWSGYLKAAGRNHLHRPRKQLKVGFKALADNIKGGGGNRYIGFRMYNGTGWAAEQYARKAITTSGKWHGRLHP